MTGPSGPPGDFDSNVFESTSGSSTMLGYDELMGSLQNLAASPVVPTPFDFTGNSHCNQNPATVKDESFRVSSTTTGSCPPIGGMLTMDASMPLRLEGGGYASSTEEEQQEYWVMAGTGNTEPGSFPSLFTPSSNLAGAAPSNPPAADDDNSRRLRLCRAVFRQNLLLQQVLQSRTALMILQPSGALPSVVANPGLLASMGQQQQPLPFQLLAASAVPGTVVPIMAFAHDSFGVPSPFSTSLPLMGSCAPTNTAPASMAAAANDASLDRPSSNLAAAPPQRNQGLTRRSHTNGAAGYGGFQKPKRALSVYNLYFKDERVNLLNEVQRKAKASGAKSKRVKIGFEDMARTIASRWKRLDPERIAEYQQRAAVDRDRYDKQMKLFNEHKLQVFQSGQQNQEHIAS